MVAGLIVVSYLQIWFPALRKWLTGVPTILISNGQPDLKQLKRSRMTIDQLEMRLRMQQIGNTSDVETAILEPSGMLSVVLKDTKKNAQKEDIQFILNELSLLKEAIRMQSNKDPFLTNGSEPKLQPTMDYLFEHPKGLPKS